MQGGLFNAEAFKAEARAIRSAAGYVPAVGQPEAPRKPTSPLQPAAPATPDAATWTRRKLTELAAAQQVTLSEDDLNAGAAVVLAMMDGLRAIHPAVTARLSAGGPAPAHAVAPTPQSGASHRLAL